jgi:hypothetical protein
MTPTSPRIPLVRRLALIGGTASLLLLTACSGGGETASIGDTEAVDIDGATYDVTVSALEEAPQEVEDQYDGGDDIYFATVEFTYTGGEDAVDPYGNVYAALSDGTFLDSIFTGMEECHGSPEGDPTEAREALAAGEPVEVCVPLSSDGDLDVTGVYVGPSDVNEEGGVVWER